LAIPGDALFLEQAREVGYRFVRNDPGANAGWRRAEKYHIGMPAKLNRKQWNRASWKTRDFRLSEEKLPAGRVQAGRRQVESADGYAED
jgi:hypothetical protein